MARTARQMAALRKAQAASAAKRRGRGKGKWKRRASKSAKVGGAALGMSAVLIAAHHKNKAAQRHAKWTKSHAGKQAAANKRYQASKSAYYREINRNRKKKRK